PTETRAHAEDGRQPVAVGRADQRPGRRDPAVAGGCAAGVPRLRRGDLPRPVVPRPRRHPHPRLGGQRHGPGAVVLVRGQLRRLRDQQARSARPGGGAAAPRPPPPAHPRLTRRGPGHIPTTMACSPVATAAGSPPRTVTAEPPPSSGATRTVRATANGSMGARPSTS